MTEDMLDNLYDCLNYLNEIQELAELKDNELKMRYDDNTEPSIIGVRTLCEHADKCPSLAYLGKQQLKLWQALQECNMQAVLNMEWIMVYQTLKTFETLGLITCPCEIVSSYQLKQMKLKLIDGTCSCRLSNPSYPND